MKVAAETMSPVDAAWLRMERPENPMTITALFLFDAPPDLAQLERVVEARLLVHGRFRQRAVDPGPFSRPRWETVPALDWRRHLVRATLPPPGDDAALRELVGQRMSRPLDRSRPLWELVLVDGYRGGGAALLVRVHHAVGDGTSLVRLLLSLTDGEEAATASLLHHPTEAWLGRGLLRRAAGMLLALPRTLALRADPRTPLQGEPGTEKRAAWSEPLPLEPLRAGAKRLRATVNDVAMAAVAGALRDHLIALGAPPDGQTVKAVVPLDLRPPERLDALGNDFGLIFLELPVGLADRRARLAAVQRSTARAKRSAQAALLFRALGAVGLTSAAIEGAIVRFLGDKTSLVMTNVVGPRRPRTLAGRPIRALVGWNPMGGRLGLTVSVFSFAGEVRIGVAADAGILPEPEGLARAIADEATRLAGLVEPPRRAGARRRRVAGALRSIAARGEDASLA